MRRVNRHHDLATSNPSTAWSPKGVLDAHLNKKLRDCSGDWMLMLPAEVVTLTCVAWPSLQEYHADGITARTGLGIDRDSCNAVCSYTDFRP